jgi:hypothetical protein
LVAEHKGRSNQSATTVSGGFEKLKFAALSPDLSVHLQLLLHLEEFLFGSDVVWIIDCAMQSDDDFACLLLAALLKKPSRRKREPWRTGKEKEGRYRLERQGKSPWERRGGAGCGYKIAPESDPGGYRVAHSKHDAMDRDHEASRGRR